jgi:hypothetical protein
MGHDLSLGHGFFSHFGPPVGMGYKAGIEGVYWKGNSEASEKVSSQTGVHYNSPF